MSEELKPCPFCGQNKIEVYRSRQDGRWRVYCYDCVGSAVNKEIAREQWNTRVESPELTRLRTENAKLKKRVERIKVIRQCRHHGSIDWKQWGCPDCVYELRNELAELRAEIAELRAKLGGEWIPVEDDRKPEEDQAIWVTVKRERFDHYVYTTIFADRFGRYVTAWMPRRREVEPEPYKPEPRS